MPDHPRYAVTTCVLLRRDRRWLLSVRADGVGHASGSLGLIGGHVEAGPADEPGVLEAAGCRELAEEAGVDVPAAGLRYVESAYFVTDDAEPQVTVTFAAEAPAGAAPVRAAPDEVAEVGWWTPGEAARDPRCPPWLPGLLRRAAEVLDAAG